MKMKSWTRVLSLLLVLLMLCGTVSWLGCNADDAEPAPGVDSDPDPDPEPEPDPDPEPEPDPDPEPEPDPDPEPEPEPEPEPDPEPEPEPVFEGLVMIDDNASAYRIVYSAASSAAVAGDATALAKQIKKLTGVSLPVATDDTPAEQYEILIGTTNRSESEEAAKTLPTHGYAISRSKDKLVVVATDDSMLALALYRLESEVLKKTESCGKGYLRVSDDLVLTESREAAMSVGEMMASEHSVVASSEFVLHGEQFTKKIRITQGAASDGKYAYFSVRRAGTDGVGGVIYKYDLTTHEKIAVSEEIAFGHGNDLTYDTKNNRIVISHGLSENHVLTMVDPETLTVIERIEITPSGSSISYNPWTDSYAMGEGNKIEYMDAEFNLTKRIYRTDYATQSYVNQGMGSDKDYIYLPLSHSTKEKNMIVVFDWEGNPVKEVPLPEPHESESFFVVGDSYYITFYHNGQDAGTYLHRVTFTLSYTAS